MKAVVNHEWGGPEVLKFEDVADPSPGPGEVLVEIEAAGVNPVDTYIRSGVYAHLPELPCILGGDAGGTVAALGAGVTGWAVGDRVYAAGTVGGDIYGCYAERVVRPADQVFPLPGNMTFQQGATLGVPYATAYYGLFNRGRAQAGDKVFVHGASGAVGTAAVQLAKARGLNVIGSAGTDAGKKLVLAQGADHVVDHTGDGYLNEVRELTGGDGPDLILEMLANVNLAGDLGVINRYGRIVVIGNRGTIEINPRDAMMKDVDILGLALWNCEAGAMTGIHADLVAMMEAGRINPIVTKELPLAAAAQAHVRILEPGAQGNMVLIPG